MSEITVARDPFARGEYRRFSHAADAGESCHWCGSKRKTLFVYVWESDGSYGRATEPHGKAFCNLGCFESYQC